LAFAAIYFIAKMLRKKQQPQKGQSAQLDTDKATYRRPKTFEELLGEITGQQQMLERQEEDEIPFGEQKQKEVVAEPIKEEPKPRHVYERKFSDEESKKVYEEAIKRADVAPLEFSRSKAYKIGASKRSERRSIQNTEIRSMLKSKQGAQKALILSEILNRKY
jgi:hypothetical protein